MLRNKKYGSNESEIDEISINGDKEKMKTEKINKIITGVAFCLTILCGVLAVCLVYGNMDGDAGAPSGTIAVPGESRDYSVNYFEVNTGKSGTEITNWKDGYSITLPEGMEGKIRGDRVNLEIDCGDTIYEIYREDMESSAKRQSYLNYSNKFMENTHDHIDAQVSNQRAGGHSLQLTQWHREKLSGVEADKNYYICADVFMDDYDVCTIFVKSEVEIDFNEDCRRLIESLTPLDASQIQTDGSEHILQDAVVYAENEAKSTIQMRSYWSDETKAIYEKYFADENEQIEESSEDDFRGSGSEGRNEADRGNGEADSLKKKGVKAQAGSKTEAENGGKTDINGAGENAEEIAVKDKNNGSGVSNSTQLDEAGGMEAEMPKLTWGVFKWGIDNHWNYLTELEDKLDHKFDILLHYSHFESTNALNSVKTVLENADREGRTVELTLQTKAKEDGNMVYDILNGEYDEFLNSYAKQIAELRIPVLFRLCNEMNGDWCQYSAFHTSRDTAVFVELYKYIFRVFREQGADAYTIWVWNPNEKSFPDYKWNSEFKYYPGDKYVDVVGITGYNTGNYYEGEVWRSFDEIYEPLYKRTVENYSRPIMITEFACSNVGGDKAKWAEDMFESIKKYDRIKVAVWWDGCDYDENGKVARSYLMEDSAGALDVFKNEFSRR